jgi:hypothetical protein
MCYNPAFFQHLKLCNVLERGYLHDSEKSWGVTDQGVANALTLLKHFK